MLQIRIRAEGDLSRHKTKVVLHARKKRAANAPKKLNLNFFVPKGLALTVESPEIESLIRHLNTVYKTTGVELVLNYWEQVDSKYLDLMTERNSS